MTHPRWRKTIVRGSIVALWASTLTVGVQAGTAAAATGAWAAAANMDTARSGNTATLLPNGKVLVTGGWDGTSGIFAVASAELYDPATDTWSSAVSMSTQRLAHTATLLPNGKVLVAGGWDSTGAPIASAELYDPATDTWSSAGSMATARLDHTATLLPNGKVLVAGGRDTIGSTFSSAELYDPVANGWSSAGSMATARNTHTATLLGGGQVLVAGGYGGSSVSVVRSAELYDPATNTWLPTGSMAHYRYVHTATLLPNGEVLVTGGATGIPGGPPEGSAELYDPGTKTWSAAASMPTGRSGHSATLLGNGTVLVAGGSDGPSVLAGAEVYDPFAMPFANPWSSAETMAVARTDHTATLLENGEVLVTGGRGGVGFSVLSSAALFDPATGDWTSAPSMAQARYDHTATLLQDGRVLVAGGSSRTPGIFYGLASAELYDPMTDSWSAAGSMATARFGQTATLLGDGRVLVTGGQDSSFQVLASAELYDPVSDSWSSAPDMSEARAGHTATLLADGTVLVAGGSGGADSLTSVELFDPTTDSWSSAASMATPRAGHTATVLGNGTVLVAGGYNDNYSDGMPLTEAYDPATDVWSPAANMVINRVRHTATLLPSGNVLVIGGDGFNNLPGVTGELFDPAANTWTQVTKNSFYPYVGHTATLLGNGKVLVAGGEGIDYGDTGRAVAFALVFANSESAAGSMAWARRYHTATLLPSGKVLVTGGLYNHVALASAELYGGTGDTTPPSVTLTTPSDNATYSWGQSVTANYSCQDESGGSGLASCTGTIASGSGIDTLIPGSHSFTVHATDNAGNSTSVVHDYSVLKGTLNGDVTVSAGATVTTDPGGVGASPEVPIQTSIQVPTGGTVSITPEATTQTPPASYTFIAQQVTISAPDASSPAAPIVLMFSLDASLGPDPSVIKVGRNGVLIADCDSTHSNLPCALIPATVDTNGDLAITAYTMQASTWNFAVHAAYAFSGFYQPVDNPPVLNVMKAGRAVPVWFALGGNQGLGIMARGYPLSQPVSCDAGARLDAIELTVPARSSSLSYVLGQYIYVWKTESSWFGTCRDLFVKLADGSVHTARFKFK